MSIQRSVFRILATLFALSLFAAPLTGCQEEDEIKVDQPEPDPEAPAPNVSLPDPPPESGFQVPEKNTDQTLRVEGLIHYQDKYLDQQVEVKGLIVKMSEPCDPGKVKKARAKARKEGKSDEEIAKITCPEPNLFIKDDQDAQKFMRIVGYDDDFVKKAKLEEGQEHVFKGTYKKVAQGFVATEDGLVLVDYVDEMPVLEEQ